MRYVLVIMLALFVGLVLVFSFESGRSKAAATHVIMLHGWSGSGSVWNTAKAQYQAAGFTVHTPNLPYSGWAAGDTRKNADFIENYIATNGLTSVQVDGHSLGGSLVYELVRVRRNPAIVSAVTRDSSIQNAGGDTGISCWAVPDQCEGSVQRNAILAAPLAAVPVLNLTRTTDTTGQPDVDCYRYYNIDHNSFASNAQVTADAIVWAQGGNPCNPSPSTPTATSTLAPSSTPTVGPSPTSTASPSPTSTPSPTATPSSCSWWQRLFGWC